MLKPPSDPASDRGSLKALFKGKKARQILEESRTEESRGEKKLLKYTKRA